MWARFGLVVLSLGLLWGGEQAWIEHASATATDFQRHPGLLFVAVALQVLAGASAGLAVRQRHRWTSYRTTRAVAVGLLPLVLVAVLLAFELGFVPSAAGFGGEVFGEVLKLASHLGRILGILVGLGVVSGFEPAIRSSEHSFTEATS